MSGIASSDSIAGIGAAVVVHAKPLLGRIEKENAAKVAKLEQVLKLVEKADIRRRQTYNGVVRDETRKEIVLQLDAEKVVRIAVDEIEERRPGKISIMPTGLDKQLSDQQLADLVLFLKADK